MKHASRADVDELLDWPFPPAPNLKADNWFSVFMALWVAVAIGKHLVRFGGGRTKKDFLRLCYELEKKVVEVRGELTRLCVCLSY